CSVLLSSESSGQIVLTQSPTVESVSIGGSVTLNCRSSSSGFTRSLAWYVLKPGGDLPASLGEITLRISLGDAAPFTDSSSRTNFMLPISGVQAEDARDYYCQQHYSFH
ncbi:KV12 protein, partial [Polyodon spathula]|nr:KV12 protein [Polyodon spathula]